MIVVDASAALSALLRDGSARRAVGNQPIHVPHLIDSELAHALRRNVAFGELTAGAGWAALDTWRRLGMRRYPMFAMFDRIWQLRSIVSAPDATYVALAEALDCPLVTADSKLARATGIRCTVTVVPR